MICNSWWDAASGKFRLRIASQAWPSTWQCDLPWVNVAIWIPPPCVISRRLGLKHGLFKTFSWVGIGWLKNFCVFWVLVAHWIFHGILFVIQIVLRPYLQNMKRSKLNHGKIGSHQGRKELQLWTVEYPGFNYFRFQVACNSSSSWI